MPKLTGVTSLRRADALGKHLSIKGWRARSVIIAAVSVFVLAACEPAEPTPVGVAPIETSQTEESSFEWVRAMPDPRPAFKEAAQGSSAPTVADSSVKEDTASEIWCVPGCLLASNLDGSPIVPEWCTAWSAMAETHFARDSDEDQLVDTNSIVVFQPASSSPVSEKFACTRINLNRIVLGSTETAAGALSENGLERGMPNKPYSPYTFRGEAFGMRCLPGCVTSWEEYGLKESDIGQSYGKNVQLPDWCAAGSKGCGPVASNVMPKCKPESIANSMCTRIRFSDVPYSDQIVGERDVD
ncbi:MAG: hypothetical protein FP825_16030 [Hyphomonas sp.]|uniref:hypothetical protein n=1 Tax=Hyphomonas sp. TaxID=87 RepID=UPI0017D60698|nr:hypothetical protein [Hyphomonas sp.]MBA3069980.1 hypothetical protein [Hyphomonas sp.]MBU3919206.1 hypothetical protein [Alphaproteobacteria bacterium]MBU4060444.1 hypothetical protein [Alphaproteobacteria bacterium]MBU4163112.1 hypothetical protein [Alphaproteobacteria bacterium]